MTRPGLLNPEKRSDDVDSSIRPLQLGEFIGQQQAAASAALGESAETGALIRQGLRELAK